MNTFQLTVVQASNNSKLYETNVKQDGSCTNSVVY